MVMEYCPGGSLMRLVQETRHQKLSQLGLLDHHYLEERKGAEESLLIGAVGLDLDLARKYFRQLILGIDYLHRNEIIRQSPLHFSSHPNLFTHTHIYI
jgi:serine/threonine protein kinase